MLQKILTIHVVNINWKLNADAKPAVNSIY